MIVPHQKPGSVGGAWNPDMSPRWGFLGLRAFYYEHAAPMELLAPRCRHSASVARLLQTQRRKRILHFVTTFLSVCGLHAAAPTLDYIFPLAFQRGSTAAVTLGGKLDPWPVSVWADCSGVTFRSETNAG